MKEFIPKYFGKTTQNDQEYLKLENLLHGKMKNASIIDFKMGKLTYGIGAAEHRIRKEKVKCQITTSNDLGIRTIGRFNVFIF